MVTRVEIDITVNIFSKKLRHLYVLTLTQDRRESDKYNGQPEPQSFGHLEGINSCPRRCIHEENEPPPTAARGVLSAGWRRDARGDAHKSTAQQWALLLATRIIYQVSCQHQ